MKQDSPDTTTATSSSHTSRLAAFARDPRMQFGYTLCSVIMLAGWWGIRSQSWVPTFRTLAAAFLTGAVGFTGVRLWAGGLHRWLGGVVSAGVGRVPEPGAVDPTPVLTVVAVVLLVASAAVVPFAAVTSQQASAATPVSTITLTETTGHAVDADADYIYVISESSGTFTIDKIDKSDYSIVASNTVSSYFDDQAPGELVVRNGYIFMTNQAPSPDGSVLKLDTTDL